MKWVVREWLNERVQAGQRMLAVLIDPDFVAQNPHRIKPDLIESCADLILLGGSLVSEGHVGQSLKILRQVTQKPIVLFPGDPTQIHPDADAVLFLSLISGRNPELLIGRHVVSAPMIKRIGLEALPTGYMLIDGGNRTSVQYISNTQPIPADKPDIAGATALAGAMLGLQYMYLDAGSGAVHPVSPAVISRVKEASNAPLFVGGGIRNATQARQALHAGADIVVVGNAAEDDPLVLQEIALAVKTFEPVSSLSDLS